MQDHVRGLDDAVGLDREQVRIAGAGTDQVYVAAQISGLGRYRSGQGGLSDAGSLENRPVRETVKQELSRFAARVGREDFASKLTELSEPRANVGWKKIVDFVAEMLCKGRTLAGSGDGDLQVTGGQSIRKRNRNWECHRPNCKGCFAREPICKRRC